MTTERTASLRPSDMSEGGGLLGSEGPVVLTWKEARFVLWDYNGTMPTMSPALRIILEEEDGTVHEEYWSAGDAKNWVPSSDGKTLNSVSSVERQNRGTKMGILMKSVVDAGFDESKIGHNVSIFDGMVAAMHQVPAPKRTGLSVPTPRADGRVFEKTDLVVDEIIRMPGEKSATPKGRAGRTRNAQAAPALDPTSDDVVTTKARETVAAVLEANIGEHPDGLTKAELVKLVFAERRQDPDRNTIIQSVNDDDFLSRGSDGLWEYEDGTVSLP